MVAQHPTKQAPQRLHADSRLTDKQLAFAKLIATGLNSASSAYRLAYKRAATGEWWCRQQAYILLQKPHIQAVVSRLKAQYDSVRPSLTRATKREILHAMAIDEDSDEMDRQRALDIDNKMQGEYAERLHLTGDLTVNMFRAQAPGAIPWQLAEEVIDIEAKQVTPNQPQLTNSDSSHSKATYSSSVSNGDQGMDHAEKHAETSLPADVPSNPIPVSQPVPTSKAKQRIKPLTPAQVAVLGKTYANRRRKTKG